MTKHTPGPWNVGHSAGHNIAKGIFSDIGYHVAEVVDVASSEGDANARLIAAAPELLEVLRRIAKTDMATVGVDNPMEWVQAMARDAIAKAGGSNG